MEFLWRPNFAHLGRKSEIYTHVIYDFDVSPFDLVIEDHLFNSTDDFEVDQDEWDWYFGNDTDDWWWTNDTYDDVTDDDWMDDEDWWTEDDADEWWPEDDDEDWVPDDNSTDDTNTTEPVDDNKEPADDNDVRLLQRRMLFSEKKLKQKPQHEGEKKFRDYVLEMSQHYKTPHVLMLVGSNVNFRDAELYYH
jgi:hypothetical protein